MPGSARLPTAQLIARWTFVLVGLTVAWRIVRFALSFPIWGDEAFVAVSFFGRGFAGMVEPLEHYQVVPAGFMWLVLAVTRGLGNDALALRLVPVVAGVASVALFWHLARRLLDRRSAFLALAIFAASYYPVRHATEVKPYSMDLLISLAILASAWRVWQRPRLASWGWFVAIAAVSVWCSYPSVFVAGGAMAVLAGTVYRGRTVAAAATWIASGTALVASFAAMYLIVARGQEGAASSLYVAGNWTEAFPPIREPWRIPAWFLWTHTGNMFAYPVGGRDGGSAVTFVLVVVGVLSLWRRRKAAACLLVAPFAVTFAAAALERYPYGDSARVVQHLAPPICLLAGAGLAAAARLIGGAPALRVTIAVTGWAMAAIIIAGLVIDVRQPYKELDDRRCRDAIEWLRNESAPTDHWVVSGGFGDRAVGPDMRPWGGRAARLRYHLLRHQQGPLAWSPPIEDLPETGVAWLVVYHPARGASAGDLNALDDYVRRVHEALGTPTVRRFEVAPEVEEWVELQRFEVARGR